jgi:hypothetical protein
MPCSLSVRYESGNHHLVITSLISCTKGTRHLVISPLVSYTKGTRHLVISPLVSYTKRTRHFGDYLSGILQRGNHQNDVFP